MVTLVWPVSISVPNVTKISPFTTEIWQKNQKFKMAAAANKFLKSVILGLSDHCMANTYLQTKTLDLLYPNFGPPTTFLLMG